MKTAFAFVLLALIVAQASALKCFKCDNCVGDDLGDPETCEADENVCMRIIAGDHIARMCEKYETCGVGKAERAGSRAWDAIANIFREVEINTPLVYCCDGDYCNSSSRGLPSLALAFLPLLVVAFFKN